MAEPAACLAAGLRAWAEGCADRLRQSGYAGTDGELAALHAGLQGAALGPELRAALAHLPPEVWNFVRQAPAGALAAAAAAVGPGPAAALLLAALGEAGPGG